MGLFNFFSKKDKNKSTSNKPIQEEPQLPFDIKFSTTVDGRLQMDFYDKQADFKQCYDTTRLIINTSPLLIQNREVYNCIVSWYGHNDTEILNLKTGQELGRRADYRGILAEIDLNLLYNDPYYCNALVNALLNRNRVERYLDNGLEESPECPCGKYIGGIIKDENVYQPYFSLAVGRASHYSSLMVNRRAEHRLKEQKQQDIARKRAEIEKLQAQINEMDRG